MTLNEGVRSLDKIDFLIKNGLGSDQSKLSFYRQILQNPTASAQSVVLRKYMAEMFENLCRHIFDDAVLYNRLRQDLLSSGKKLARMKPSAFESLVSKWMSISEKVPFDTIIEEYEIGYEDDTRPQHLSREQYAFNRVNAFIANKNTVTESKTMNTIKKIVRKRVNGL